MHNLIYLEREYDINKVLKAQKASKATINILFISLWDDACKSLMRRIKNDRSEGEEKIDTYVINSFDMPHSFMIYRVTKCPFLVRLRGNKIDFCSRVSTIYKALGLP